jgi:Sec-independent protein secretion pathway component TatC
MSFQARITDALKQSMLAKDTERTGTLRLIKAALAFLVMFMISFYFAKEIYNLLVVPFEHAAGPDAKLIYTAPQEFFFTQIKVAMFTAFFASCPVIFSQIYAFVAPGLYKHERMAFAPYLVATPIVFALGAVIGLVMARLGFPGGGVLPARGRECREVGRSSRG